MEEYWIGLDGRGLSLDQGTGVSSYGIGLAQVIGCLGYRRELLIDHPQGPASQLWRWARALSPAVRATQVGPGVAGFERVRSGDDLFRLAQVHFDIYRRPLALSGASPPAVMHWTYPLPIVLRGARNIYTIHDIIPQTAPELTPISRARNRAMLKAILARATHIVTVSEHSRRAIIDEFAYPPDRVTNVYQAWQPDGAVEWEPLPRGLTPQGFYLALGTIEKRKNIGRLIAAYRAAGVQVPLVLAGPNGWMADAELATAAHHPNIVVLGYQPRPAIQALLRNARALLFPSLAEGFGLPIIEAMALGTPVITARGGATGEVAGDAALLVDPLNIDDIAAKIVKLDGDPALAAMLAERGRVRAAAFSPEAYAKRLGALYRRLLSPGI